LLGLRVCCRRHEPGWHVISVDALAEFLRSHAYFVVLVGTFVDATGTPFPGRLLLITAGGLAATGGVGPTPLIALATVGAVLGDHVWYVAGRLAGGRVVQLYCRLRFFGTTGCADRARTFVKRFGPAAVIVGRFVAGVRVLVTPLAAESGMPYLRYVACDAIGAALWCSLWVLLGFALGDQWAAWQDEHGKETIVALLGAGAVVALSGAFAYRLWERRRSRRLDA
jgi:membrane protein DedA with SNARE-associated domain